MHPQGQGQENSLTDAPTSQRWRKICCEGLQICEGASQLEIRCVQQHRQNGLSGAGIADDLQQDCSSACMASCDACSRGLERHSAPGQAHKAAARLAPCSDITWLAKKMSGLSASVGRLSVSLRHLNRKISPNMGLQQGASSACRSQHRPAADGRRPTCSCLDRPCRLTHIVAGARPGGKAGRNRKGQRLQGPWPGAVPGATLPLAPKRHKQQAKPPAIAGAKAAQRLA